MYQAQINSDSKKRGYHQFMTQELQGKLSSKEDFYTYMDKHRKYSIIIV